MKYLDDFLVKTLLIWCLIVLFQRGVRAESDDDEVDEKFPKLLQFFPKNPNSAYTLNEKSTFTNSLNTGWIIKAITKVELLLYVLVDEQIKSLNDIKFGYVYFTTKKNECDLNLNKEEEEEEFSSRETDEDYQEELEQEKKQKLTFKLRFLGAPRSKFLTKDNIEGKKQNVTLLAAETSVRLQYDSNKYYACLNVASKNASQRDFLHQGTDNPLTQIITTKDFLPFYLVIFAYLLLLCCSALFSGLNLGLMSLDLAELELLKKIGSKKEQIYANNIYPLRTRGNYLLCTILLGNVLVNSTSTLILGNYLEGIFAAAGSTLLIVLFGEIIPQAACSRYGLAVGSYTRYFTKVVMCLTFPISFPLSKALDYFLGKEIAVKYSRDKVKELMRSAAKDKKEQKQFKLISGALDFNKKNVGEIMKPIKDVFSLDINTILDFDTFKAILYHGYSRIPVHEHTKENFVGMILIQDLLLNDPADKVPLKAVMDYYKHPVLKCKLGDGLEGMLEKLRKGASHMAFVYNDDAKFYDEEDQNKDSSSQYLQSSSCLEVINEAVGILTLENIIEALVDEEIMDEADTKRERRKKRAKEYFKGKLANLSISNENLNIFVKEVDQTNKPVISTQIKKALFYFLASSVKPFTGEFISPKSLEIFLRRPELIKERRNLSNDTNTDIYLYQYGVECDYFIIILEGNALVQVGKEGMEINAGLFSFYGVNALIDESQKDPLECIGNDSTRKPYKPEFSLKVNSYCVYMQITRAEWKLAVKNSIMERSYAIKTNDGVKSNAPVSAIPKVVGNDAENDQKIKIVDMIINEIIEKKNASQNDLSSVVKNNDTQN